MKKITLLCLVASIVLSCKNNSSDAKSEVPEPKGVENVAYKWGGMALEATALDTERFNPRPTITSRYLGLIFTAVFDAWSRFDEKATPVYLDGVERRPLDEMTLKNKEIAISYAALRTMNEYYYTDSALFEKFMKEELGLDPMDTSMDPTTPAGIGNLAAKAVIEARKGDGVGSPSIFQMDKAESLPRDALPPFGTK